MGGSGVTCGHVPHRVEMPGGVGENEAEECTHARVCVCERD